MLPEDGKEEHEFANDETTIEDFLDKFTISKKEETTQVSS